MIILVFASIVALFLVYYTSKDEIPFGLELAFLLITLVAAIRYNYGNDYIGYKFLFDYITRYDFSFTELLKHTYYKESGWALLCFLFKPFGFLWMVAFLSVVENIAYYIFIRLYVPKDWWVLGMFIYLTSTSLYVLNMSMMRQGLVVAIFLSLWPLIKGKNIFKNLLAFLVILIASNIHSSALMLVPLSFWGFIPIKKGVVVGVVLIIMFVFLFFNIELLNHIFLQFVDVGEIERYVNNYNNNSVNKFGIGFFVMLLPFFISIAFLIFSQNASIAEKQIVTLASMGSLVLPFTQIIALAGRMGFYFAPFTIASIPITYKWLPVWCRKIFLSLFVFISCYNYWLFFHSDIYKKFYLQFHSIFEVLF